MMYFTNAPVEYDYGYVEDTNVHFLDRFDTAWRLLKVHNLRLFKAYQIPRYASGLYVAFPANSEDAQFYGLPEVSNV